MALKTLFIRSQLKKLNPILTGLREKSQEWEQREQELTAELDKSLKDVGEQSRKLQAELNAVERLLKFDPENVDLLTQKQRLLNEQMELASKKTEAFHQAQERVKDLFARGEIDEGKYRDFERQLISAEQQLEKFSSASDECNGKLKEVSEHSELLGAGLETAGAAAAAAALAIAAVVEAGKKIGEIAQTAAAYADNVLTLSTNTHVAAETIQELQYMAELTDTSFETVSVALKKNTKAMSEARQGTAQYVEAYDRLGVSVTNTDGTLRDGYDVFLDTIDALGKIGNETERDALSMEIFGKSAADLNSLIAAGKETLREYGDEAQRVGTVLSEEQLNTLGELDDRIQRLAQVKETVVNSIGAEVAPAVNDLLDMFTARLPDVTNAVNIFAAGLAEMLSPSLTDKAKNLTVQYESLCRQAERSVSNAEAEISTIQAKASLYEDLRTKMNLTAVEQETLKQLAVDLQNLLPDTTAVIDTQTGAYLNCAGAVKQLTDNLREQAVVQAYEDKITASAQAAADAMSIIIDAEMQIEEKLGGIKDKAERDYILENTRNDVIRDAVRSKEEAQKLYDEAIADQQKYYEQIEKIQNDSNSRIGEIINQRKASITIGNQEAVKSTAQAVSEMAEYYEQQGKAAIKTVEDYETATQTALDEIEHRYKTHQLTEQEYFAEIERYLKSHANAESELYWEMSDRVTAYYAGLKKTAVETQETVTKVTEEETDNRLELLQKELETQLSEYEKNLSSIQGKINSLADKFTAEFKDKFTFSTDEDGKFKMEVDGDFIVDKNAELEKYLAQIDELKKRGISEDLLQQLSNMTVEEGMKVAEYYDSLTDQQLKNLTDHWNEYNETSRRLAESLYADEVEQVTDSYINGVVGKLNETAPELQQAGLAMAQALVSGFDIDGVGAENLAQLKAHISEMLSQALSGHASGIPSAQDEYLDECLKQLYERDKAFADALNNSTDKVAEAIKEYNLSLPDLTGLTVPTVQSGTAEKTEDLSAKRHTEMMDMLAEMYEVLLQKQKLMAEFKIETELVLDNEKFGRLVSGVIRKEV